MKQPYAYMIFSVIGLATGLIGYVSANYYDKEDIKAMMGTIEKDIHYTREDIERLRKVSCALMHEDHLKIWESFCQK